VSIPGPYNFGDLLSPIIVNALTNGLKRNSKNRLMSIGSIMHFAHDHDTIWGSGVNGKIPSDQIKARNLDIRAIRGPLSRKVLKMRGLECPEVYGDPGLLLSVLKPETHSGSRGTPILLVPNYNDTQLYEIADKPFHHMLVSPFGSPTAILAAILDAEIVLTSSLHILICAEALGIPVRLVLLDGHEEATFKYEDYFEGTGRCMQSIFCSFMVALESRAYDKLEFDSTNLLQAFPIDQFEEQASWRNSV
jgi:pyruvyltransferase